MKSSRGRRVYFSTWFEGTHSIMVGNMQKECGNGHTVLTGRRQGQINAGVHLASSFSFLTHSGPSAY